MKTLIVIDMQKGLLAPSLKANPTGIACLVKNIADLMHEFKYQQWPIMMVKFVQYDTPIIPELLSIVKNYKCWQLVNKDKVDGNDAILSQQRYWKWPLNFVICGIYGNACIPETINGLIKKERKARVEVMVDAIFANYHDWVVNKEKSDKQVRLVKQGDWNINTIQEGR